MAQYELFGDGGVLPPRACERFVPYDPSRQNCFFAVRPSETDAGRIGTLAEPLLAAHGVKGTRVAAERLHITLVPIGWAEDLASVEAACRAADLVRMPPIDVCLDAAMTYRPDAFVLLGDRSRPGGVSALRTVLGCALADRGFRPKTGFNPHMTLSYDRRNRVDSVAIDPITFHVDEFCLIKSHVGLTRHEVLRTWALRG